MPPAIFACQDARAPHWQLGPLPPATGRLTLIGWQTGERQDAGVPEEIARVLSLAFTSVARLTFPCSLAVPVAASGWTPSQGDLIRTLTDKGIRAGIMAKWKGSPSRIALLSTRRPESAMQLFDDAGFPWWSQGQIVLLSGTEGAPPDIDAASLLALFGEEWTKHAAALVSLGIKAVLRPGVDGDVAGLLAINDKFERELLAALEREAHGAKFGWALLPEKDFAP